MLRLFLSLALAISANSASYASNYNADENCVKLKLDMGSMSQWSKTMTVEQFALYYAHHLVMMVTGSGSEASNIIRKVGISGEGRAVSERVGGSADKEPADYVVEYGYMREYSDVICAVKAIHDVDGYEIFYLEGSDGDSVKLAKVENRFGGKQKFLNQEEIKEGLDNIFMGYGGKPHNFDDFISDRAGAEKFVDGLLVGDSADGRFVTLDSFARSIQSGMSDKFNRSDIPFSRFISGDDFGNLYKGDFFVYYGVIGQIGAEYLPAMVSFGYEEAGKPNVVRLLFKVHDGNKLETSGMEFKIGDKNIIVSDNDRDRVVKKFYDLALGSEIGGEAGLMP